MDLTRATTPPPTYDLTMSKTPAVPPGDHRVMDCWNKTLDGQPISSIADVRSHNGAIIKQYRDSRLSRNRNISKIKYDALPYPKEHAFREYEAVFARRAVSNHKERRIDRFVEQQAREQRSRRRNWLVERALCANKRGPMAAQQARLEMIRDSGGDDDTTLACYPVEDVLEFEGNASRKTLEEVYPDSYPAQRKEQRWKSAEAFIPDNYIAPHKLLSNLAAPKHAISFDNIAHFDEQVCCAHSETCVHLEPLFKTFTEAKSVDPPRIDSRTPSFVPEYEEKPIDEK